MSEIEHYGPTRTSGIMRTRAIYEPVPSQPGLPMDDIFRPSDYEIIRENANGNCGIFSSYVSNFPYASAVLVSSDLVLTCWHCVDSQVKRDRLHTIRIGFGHEGGLPGSATVAPDFFEIKGVVHDGRPRQSEQEPHLDFAILRLKPRGRKKAGDIYPVQRLTDRHMPRFSRIYVVGYPHLHTEITWPKHFKRVHDNAFILFPFEVSAPELDELFAVVAAEYEHDEERQAALQEMQQSYVLGDDSTHRYHYQREEVAGFHQPACGAVCDTFDGNSGGGVYLRANHAVAGLLMAGREDIRIPYVPGWRDHEAIFPIRSITERVEARDPGFLQREGITVVT